MAEMVSINKSELDKLVRGIVKEELEKISIISSDEQKELENLYGNTLYEKNYNKKDYVRL